MRKAHSSTLYAQKILSILYRDLPYRNGQDFWNIQYKGRQYRQREKITIKSYTLQDL